MCFGLGGTAGGLTFDVGVGGAARPSAEFSRGGREVGGDVGRFSVPVLAISWLKNFPNRGLRFSKCGVVQQLDITSLLKHNFDTMIFKGTKLCSNGPYG